MKQVVIASNNKGKVSEFKKIFSDNRQIELLSLSDLGIDIEIEETGKTFEENAYIKAKTIYDMTKLPTIADDSGLMVDFLNGEPGVMSARYAGEGASEEARIAKLLEKLKDVPKEKRSAKFVSAIVFIISSEELGESEEFESKPDNSRQNNLKKNNNQKIIKSVGECFGKIAFEPMGENGFGYDPIFLVQNSLESEKTFAQLSKEEKNQISHRGKALRDLKKQINNLKL